jgi:hypothetical protein
VLLCDGIPGTLSAGAAVALKNVPAALVPSLRRLSRRLFLGLFLETWPRWAAGALLASGGIVLVCRIMVPAAEPYLLWLLAAPALAILPALLVSSRRAYGRADVLALADALTGGGGLVVTLAERQHEAWGRADQMIRAASLPLPRVRPWRRLAVVLPAFLFLLGALLVPQRVPAFASSAMADEIAAGLSATLADLKAQAAVTAEEEQRLEEEIARVRKAAQERMDASAWEAADALKEQMAAKAAARRDAAQWAQEALARYAAAAAGGPGASDPASGAAAAAKNELSQALDALAKSGAMAGAPADLQKLVGAGAKLPGDAASLGQLAASLAEFLGSGKAALGDLRAFGDGPARFDPSEFAAAADGDQGGRPGRGGVNRGRADAALTWGEETRPADRFKPQALPPGFVRSPDDWAPIVTLPGAPDVAPEAGSPSAARTYEDDAGQAAWRRTVAPRHQSAVKKYFQP